MGWKIKIKKDRAVLDGCLSKVKSAVNRHLWFTTGSPVEGTFLRGASGRRGPLFTAVAYQIFWRIYSSSGYSRLKAPRDKPQRALLTPHCAYL